MYAQTGSYGFETESRTSMRRTGALALCAGTGALCAFTVSMGGQMPVGELILLAVFPWVLLQGYMQRGWPARLQQLGWFKLMLVLAAITAFGYVASDLYRGTAHSNLVRGWARVGFLVLDLVTLAYLVDRSWTRLRAVVVGLYAGHVAHALVYGPLHGEWWKFGVGYPLTVLVLLLVAGRRAGLQSAIALGLAILNFSLGARSLGAICLLIAAVLILRQTRGIWRPIVLGGSLAAALGVGILANTLILEDQDHSGSNLERRSMIETSLELFVRSPLVGQGSWFTAGSGLEALEAKRASVDPHFRAYTPEEAQQLAIHSQLLAALAEGGLLGGAFFFGLGALLLKTTRTLLWFQVPYRAFVLFLVLSGLWNLLMTPFSGVTRVEIALATCVGLLTILQRQGELPEVSRE